MHSSGILRDDWMKRIIGIPDEDFIRGKVPMTKREIRILTIANAQLEEDSVVCDVGAGTGSLSIESALQAPLGRVYAIERKPEALELIKRNAEKFGVDNLRHMLNLMKQFETVVSGELEEKV